MKVQKGRVLVVDDSIHIFTTLKQLLKRNVELIEGIRKPELVMEKLSGNRFNLVLLDMNFKAGINSGNEGIYWLKEIKHHYPDLPVVMITAYGNIDLAVKSMKEGANDFVSKPWNPNEIISKVASVLAKRKEKVISSAEDGPEIKGEPRTTFIGNSGPIKELKKIIDQVAGTGANILLTVENGTGKNLVASIIHQKSDFRDRQMVSIDIGALTETLFESELFGYTAGAFTGAKTDRPGKLEFSHKNTLFLDEIANISLAQQQKLLTVLQEKQFSPLGSPDKIDSDFRLICATNQDPKELVLNGLFREDLFYRINTIEIRVPPLRERKSDILTLGEHFLWLYSEKYNRKISGISESTVSYMLNYAWPGNVRQLAHEIEKAVILSSSDELEIKLIAAKEIRINAGHETNLSEIEKQTIIRVLDKNKGNLSKSAADLGISRSTLYVKIEKYDIQ